MRWWAFWRRVQYLAAFSIVAALIGTGLYYMYGYEEPTCFDGIQNGMERGIDCGGVCKHICSIDVIPLNVQWVSAFKIVDGQYNVVAYVENRNEEYGSEELQYTFKLYNEMGGLIGERTGSTVLPPDGVYPVFEGKILTGESVPAKTVIEFGEGTIWQKGAADSNQYTIEKRDLIDVDSKPRLTALIRNTSLVEGQDVEIIATIFDSSRRPLTASRTFVPYFSGRTAENTVFTWPEPIAKTLRSCDIPTDVALAIDLSGSMNNDSANPPEPISSVLVAAKEFAGNMNEEDQVSLITYATKAAVTETLTNDHVRVADVIARLTIDPKEETGSTNTGEAIQKMREELLSSRHNQNARKVAILLTDGLATAPGDDPDSYAKAESDTLKASGALLFTIGLGEAVNEAFLAGLASDPALFYKAPTTKDLSKIYSAIKKSICEDGATVIDIIAKPQTTFE